MPQWSLLSEYIALILTALLMSFFYDSRQDASGQMSHIRTLFWRCLWLSAFSILLNVATVITIENAEIVPLPLNIILNSIYYFVSVLMSLSIADYLYEKLFEYAYSKTILKAAHYLLIFIACVYAILIAINTGNGMIFYFDSNMVYTHGPLNNIVYAAPAIEIIILLLLGLMLKQGMNQSMRKAVTRIPLTIVLLLILQIAYPDQLLNGMISITACYIIYFCFQSSQVELDPLTGIANRQSFSREVENRLSGRSRFQIIFVSLRDFAQTNNILGVKGGDAILIEIAKQLRKTCQNGRVYRYSNVGFALLLDSQNTQERRKNLDDVLNCMKRKWLYEKIEAPVQFSISEILYSGENWTSEDLFGYLSYSMMTAKRNNLELLIYDTRITERFEHNEKILRSLQNAIKNDTVKVYYQPVLLTATGTFDTAEALLRVKDENDNQISPEEFVPVAEENGLMDDLSWVAFEHACKLLKSGKIPTLRSINVNLTMPQLMQRDLKERMMRLINKYELDISQLKLEVTEQALAESGEIVMDTMREMSNEGFAFLLDDFGTGYSNFQSIIKFPFAAIKLDKTLISGIADDSRSQITADTLIPFFHELGHYVVAEGVETEEQAQQALQYGADFIQGFYYAKPMPSEDLIEWYEENE